MAKKKHDDRLTEQRTALVYRERVHFRCRLFEKPILPWRTHAVQCQESLFPDFPEQCTKGMPDVSGNPDIRTPTDAIRYIRRAYASRTQADQSRRPEWAYCHRRPR